MSKLISTTLQTDNFLTKTTDVCGLKFKKVESTGVTLIKVCEMFSPPWC